MALSVFRRQHLGLNSGGSVEAEVLRGTISVGVGAEPVVLHVPTGTYLRLNPVASEILGGLERGHDIDGVAALIAQHYEIPLERARADVEATVASIGQLRARRPPPLRRLRLSSALRVLRQWTGLPWAEKRASAGAALVLVLAELGLRISDLPTVARWAGAPLAYDDACPDPHPDDVSGLDEAEQRAYWATGWVLARWPLGDTCLRRALVLGWSLRRRRPRLRVGLTKGENPVAHAWLETDAGAFNAVPVVGGFSAALGDRGAGNRGPGATDRAGASYSREPRKEAEGVASWARQR